MAGLKAVDYSGSPDVQDWKHGTTPALLCHKDTMVWVWYLRVKIQLKSNPTKIQIVLVIKKDKNTLLQQPRIIDYLG